MPFALTETQLLARLNAAPGVHVERRAFGRSIRPLMVQRGEAVQVGTGRTQPWVYDPRALWQWEQYLAVRAELIRRGEWSGKRPYSVRDLEGVALLGEHAGVLAAVWPEGEGQEKEATHDRA